ncbi:MAG: ribulose-phosphate 3-epimerase [Desulfobacterales bacterium]|nr:ribulose-phosphate 3-epimerase [Desulfobacterales bacterium]
MKLIAPSILSADFSVLGDEIRAVEDAGADWIHVDVMDGHFVPNISMGTLVVEAVKKVTKLPIDVHLMIQNPDLFINDFAGAGATHICVQAETCVHLNRTIQLIRENANVRAGVALNPSTPLSALEWVLEDIDYILIMSVNPGFGGQKFIENSLQKIQTLRQVITDGGYSTLIQIDGGVNKSTIGKIAAAGADVFVAGSAIYQSANYKETIAQFRNLIAEAI